jgi:hypothetical protein
MFRTYQNALWQTQKLPKGTDRKASSNNVGRPPALLSEEHALECRARHEFHNWEDYQCADHYGTTLTYMQRFLNYETRSHLIAKPEHANL